MDKEKKENLKEVIEWIACIVIAVIIALLVRQFVFTPTVVRECSMNPTLIDGERLILDRWSITTNKEIKRGDIITFEAPTNSEKLNFDEENPIADYSNEPDNIFSKFIYYVLEITKKSYIKRVIAVEDDHILIEDR